MPGLSTAGRLGYDLQVALSADTAIYTIRNDGDEDLAIDTIDPPHPQVTAHAPLPLVLHPAESFAGIATYAPAGSGLHATLKFLSNASNRSFAVIATGRGNSPPVFYPIGRRSASAFITLQSTVAASDLDSDPIELSFQGLPARAAFDPGSGEFAWTPGIADEGMHILTFSASVGYATDTETVAITVVVLNRPPVLEQPTDMTAIALGTTDQTLAASISRACTSAVWSHPMGMSWDSLRFSDRRIT